MIKTNIKYIIVKENVWIILALIFISITYFWFRTDYGIKVNHKDKNDLETLNHTTNIFNQYRKICLMKLRGQIVAAAESLSLRNKTVLFIDLPDHMNYGDTLIWLGEEIIIKELNINIKARYTDWKFFNSKEDAFDYVISPSDEILMHGGGNFGDIWRIHSIHRNKFIARFKENTFILFPQTINYINHSLIQEDYNLLLQNKKLYITTRCSDSQDFAKKYFPKIVSMYVPDSAFMLGPINPIGQPIYDILILRRTDKESKFALPEWEAAYLEILSFKYTYIDVDWYFYKEEKYLYMSNYYKDDYPILSPNSSIHIQEILNQRRVLVNKIMSQGRIIVTDRMHASIYALLLGKVHIIVDDLYKKIFNTRESAFSDKFECRPEFLRSYYAFSPRDAIKKAVEILNSQDFID